MENRITSKLYSTEKAGVFFSFAQAPVKHDFYQIFAGFFSGTFAPLEVKMKKTFFVGNKEKHKIKVDFRATGKEKVYVDDVLVIDNRNFSMKGDCNFKAGEHDVRIKYKGDFKEWSCPVFVDGDLFIEELFEEELKGHKKRLSSLPKFLKFLGIIVIIVLLFSFLKGFYQGLTGG